MKINLDEKFKNNIVKKYGNESFENDDSLSEKEKEMWTIVLWMLKDNYPNVIFDTESDRGYLEGCVNIFVSGECLTKFTYEEWVDYLSSK